MADVWEDTHIEVNGTWKPRSRPFLLPLPPSPSLTIFATRRFTETWLGPFP